MAGNRYAGAACRRDVTRGPGWSGLADIGHALARSRTHTDVLQTTTPQTNIHELAASTFRNKFTHRHAPFQIRAWVIQERKVQLSVYLSVLT